MKASPVSLLIGIAVLSVSFVSARAEVKPDKVRTADAKKTKAYITDGVIIGGDKSMDDVAIRDIRRATNAGFERVVIDIHSSQTANSAAISRPPYYQVAVTSDESRVLFTIWGKPRLDFDSKKVIAAFKKSAVVKNLVLLPRVEEDSWTFAIELKGGRPVEVFELSNPVRLIMDIRSDAKGGGSNH
jgi:hypothetical protein